MNTEREPRNPMDHDACIHSVSLRDFCVTCYENGQRMKREIVERYASRIQMSADNFKSGKLTIGER